MNKILKSVLVVVVLSFFALSLNTSAFAKSGPKGWFKGEKKGWNGSDLSTAARW